MIPGKHLTFRLETIVVITILINSTEAMTLKKVTLVHSESNVQSSHLSDNTSKHLTKTQDTAHSAISINLSPPFMTKRTRNKRMMDNLWNTAKDVEKHHKIPGKDAREKFLNEAAIINRELNPKADLHCLVNFLAAHKYYGVDARKGNEIMWKYGDKV